jgi:hypothetical protein
LGGGRIAGYAKKFNLSFLAKNSICCPGNPRIARKVNFGGWIFGKAPSGARALMNRLALLARINPCSFNTCFDRDFFSKL